MRTRSILMLAAFAASACSEVSTRPMQTSADIARTPAPIAGEERIIYPESRRVDQEDVLQGVRVADPYRWLEDLDSEETRRWVEAQNRVTSAYLGQIADRETTRARLTELWNYERYGVPTQRGGRYFYTKNDGLQNQGVVYWAPSLEAEPRVLIDPNTFSDDGTVALTGMGISEDGRHVAYGISSGGSDWQEWKVREVDTGRDLDDHLQWVKFSGAAWTHDGAGFFYGRYDEPEAGGRLEDANFFQKLYYHRLGTPQSEDVLVYHRPDQKTWGFAPMVTNDGNYLVIHVWQGTEVENGVFYKDLRAPDSPVVELLADFDAYYGMIDNDGPVFWMQTNLDAPMGRVVAVDLRNPERSSWRELIPQAGQALQGTTVLNDGFVAVYLEDAHSKVRFFDLDGRFRRDLELPGLGSVGGFPGRREDRETFYTFTSFTTPGTIYRHDLQTGESTVFRRPSVAFDPAGYEVRQVFYASKDGTRVPMFIAHKKGLKLDGTNPTFLYGYGGFGASQTPEFSVFNLVWMERGGVYALAATRGGGEYGEEWHKAGAKLKRQNVFDDFIAGAEWLVANGYTSPGRLAIGGHSNGGLLTAASMIQRPDLFGAVLVGVGVLDMLRFHKFTIGWGWVSDYGSPDDPEEFKALYAYSPYHNLKPGTAYPPTIITTADHDDRVVPAHSFKFAAALQHAQGGPEPVLIRVETRAGHGGGKPTSKKIEEAADVIGFLWKELTEN